MNSTKIKIFIKNKDRLIYKNNNKYYYRYDNRFININKNKLTDNFGVIGMKGNKKNKKIKAWRGGNDKVTTIRKLKKNITKIETIVKELDFNKNIVKYNHINNIKNILNFLEKYRIILIQLIESKYGDDEDNPEFTKSIISSIKIILFDKIFLNYLVNIINYFIQDKDIDSVNKLIDILTFKGNSEIDNLLGEEDDTDTNTRDYFDKEYEKKKTKIIQTIKDKKENFESEYKKYIKNINDKKTEDIKNIENEDIVFDDNDNDDNDKLYEAIKAKLITECSNNIKKSFEILRESVDIKKYWAILKDTAIYEIKDTNIFKTSENDDVLDILKYKKNVLIMINNILYKCITQNIKIFWEDDQINANYYNEYNNRYSELNKIISNISIIEDKDKDKDYDKTLIDNKINEIKNINEAMILKQLKYQSDLNNYFEIYNEFIERIVNEYIINIKIYYTPNSSTKVQPTKKTLFINSVNIMTIFLKNLIFNIKENFNTKITEIDLLFNNLQEIKKNNLEN